MSLETWWIFLVAVFLLSGTPGPNMLHILTRSVEVGLKRTIAAMLGAVSGVVFVLIASAAGLTALLLTVPGIFDVLRYAGMAYLIYLGVRCWCAPVTDDTTSGQGPVKTVSLGKLYRTALAVSLSNPKLLLFCAAFLPQFINPSEPRLPQFAILIVTFACVEIFWFFIYALSGRTLSRYLARHSVKRWFNRVTGGIFIAFGLALFKARPA